MAVAITEDDLFFVTECLKSRDGDDIHGYIDRQTGQLLMGSTDQSLESMRADSGNDPLSEAELRDRYVQIPQIGLGYTYEDMVDFIATVEDRQLQALLEVAIQGSGAFGRFKNVLRRPGYDAVLEAWYAFRDKKEMEQTLDWLHSQGFCVETGSSLS